MQIFLAETETKTKETLNKKRNLFGLGLTSLIAACGDKAADDGGDGGDVGGGPGDPDTLPFKAAALTEAIDSDYTATVSGTDSLTVEIEKANADTAALIFSEATNNINTLPNSVNIYQLTTTENQYDLVISAPSIDKNEKIGTTDDNNPEYRKGKIFIYWDVANVIDEDSTHLEIKSAARESQTGTHAPDFLQLTGTDNNYDMVIRSSENDKVISGSRTYEGAIYILWDVADYKTGTTKAIDLGKLGEDGTPNLNATAGSLAIYGLTAGDQIGIHAPEFLQIGGADNKYDMVIRSKYIDNPDGPASFTDNEGGIFILWDIVDYKASTLNKAIILDSSLDSSADSGLLAIYGGVQDLELGADTPDFLELGGKDNNHDMVIRASSMYGSVFILWDIESYANATTSITIDGSLVGGATAGSLAIYGLRANDNIGTHAPEFLQIGGADNKYDMVIRSENVHKPDGDDASDEGAIYVLWDVADYKTTLNKTITLDSSLNDNADSGLLAIYGENRIDKIGTYAPEFLQIGGDGNNKLDMVIRSKWVDKPNSTITGQSDEGGIFILWDVADYANATTSITLDGSLAGGATAGSLAIYGAGAAREDWVGIHAPEFLQIAGKDDNQDMVIRSEFVAKTGTSSGQNTGAIYVLWDVADYYDTEANSNNKIIDLGAASDNADGYYATSGLLTIYGAYRKIPVQDSGFESLGNDVHNILYDTAADGSKSLTNIDGDDDATKDISFRDKDYTYILFGDKVATTTGTGGDEKVDSKTIDLADISGLSSSGDSYFGYDFGSGNVDNVGYRFANRKEDLAAVQDAYDAATSTALSNTDSDLAAWDIA